YALKRVGCRLTRAKPSPKRSTFHKADSISPRPRRCKSACRLKPRCECPRRLQAINRKKRTAARGWFMSAMNRTATAASVLGPKSKLLSRRRARTAGPARHLWRDCHNRFSAAHVLKAIEHPHRERVLAGL